MTKQTTRVLDQCSLGRLKLIPIAFFLLTLGPSISAAQTVTDIHSFTGNNSSDAPGNVTLAQGRDGVLYGTTEGQNGTVFKVATTGLFKQLHTFGGTDGAQPDGGVTLASDGSFYGTAISGGSASDGVLFKITTNGTYSVLHEFSGGTDGAVPASPPIQASDGKLYGTTYGNSTTSSTIYKYNRISNSFTTIYQFDQNHGLNVIASLAQGADGNLYGTAYQGGANGCGTAFKLATSGVLIWDRPFLCAPGGASPVGALIQGSDGNFYGTTSAGGTAGAGTVFKLSQDGVISILYSFVANSSDGQTPYGGLLQGTDGNLYGTSLAGGTSGGGTLFQITMGGTYKQLYSFSNLGTGPRGSLLQHTNGSFYGTASGGGRFTAGAVFSLNMGLGPFITFVQPTGGVGKTAQIVGQGFTGTTSVTFNNIPATTFNVVSNTYMTAVIPVGATTGPVVVTTPTGTLISNKNFQVIGTAASGSKSRSVPPHKAAK